MPPVELSARIVLDYDPAHPEEAERVLDKFAYFVTELAKLGVTPLVLSPAVDAPDPEPMQPRESPREASGPGPSEPPPKRVRDRTAERRAAKEKAEAEARAQASGNGAAEADTDDPLLGAASGPGTGDPFGDDVDEDAPDTKAPVSKPAVEERVRTPKECMDGSIVLLRQCFAQGGADAVKALQKTYKVSKFIDLPLDVAPGLWKESLALAQKLQIKIPPGL